MRILLVEDDLKIASFILKGMKEAGFAVDNAADGEDGLHMALTEAYCRGERASKNNFIFDVEKILSIFSTNIVKLALLLLAAGLAAGIYRSGTIRR